MKRYARPLRLLAITALSVFLGETLVMLLLPFLEPLPQHVKVLLDASLVTALVLPMLYYFLFRPMALYIGERDRTQKSLSKLSSAVEQTADAVVITGMDGVIEYVNPAFESYTGYTQVEALGQTPRILKSGKHNSQFYEALWKTILAGGVFRGELINKKKNGELFHAEHTITPLKDDSGSITHFVSVWKDITERRRAEEALQTFSQRVMDAQEAERRHIARELHDEMGQALTALSISLQTAEETAESPAAAEQLHQCLGFVERLLQQVRSLSLDLRPSMLDDLGLASALRWYVDSQGQRAGFIPQMELDSLKTRLPPELETAFFRIAQEAVTNVVRHAHARQVRVQLHRREQEMEMVISDDGCGFDAQGLQTRNARETSAGLLGMRERVLLLGGQIAIDSAPGRGTEIRVRVPVE